MSQRILQTAITLAAVLFCLSCGLNPKVSISETEVRYQGEKSKLSVELFVKLNYQVKKFSENSPSDWHKEQFQTLWIRDFKVKRNASLTEQPDTFPRYTVIEEVYDTEQSAARRLERIQEQSSNLPTEQQYYWMVTGFRHHKNIYFIQTDTAAFDYYMKNFADKLSKEIQLIYN